MKPRGVMVFLFIFVLIAQPSWLCVSPPGTSESAGIFTLDVCHSGGLAAGHGADAPAIAEGIASLSQIPLLGVLDLPPALFPESIYALLEDRPPKS